jgi:hypothetical protein
MSRKIVRLAVVLSVLAVLVPAIALTQGRPRQADLVITAASEPPDFLQPGSTFVVTYSIANQGRRNANTSTTRIFLSDGRRPSADDRALASSRSPRIRPRSQRTQRIRATVPANLASGRYYLIVCADDLKNVDERRERNNCHLSGQWVFVGATPEDRGPAGPQGPPGEAGPPGDTGPAAVEFYSIPRTVMSVGTANVDDILDDDSEPNAGSGETQGTADEGSTERAEVLVVGPFKFRTLCRRQVPFDDFADPTGDERRDEAKFLVYHDTDGTMAFSGPQGARANVPAGEGQAGADGATGGEGKHQLIAITRDDDGGMGAGGAEENAGGPEGSEDNYVAGLGEGSYYIVHSSGWEVVFDGYAGIDVLGAGEPHHGNDDKCVFGGSVTVVTKPEGGR